MISKTAGFYNVLGLVFLFSACCTPDAAKKSGLSGENELERLEFEALRLLSSVEEASRYEWDRTIESCLKIADRYQDSETGLHALDLARSLAAERAIHSKDVVDHRQAERLAVLLRGRRALLGSEASARSGEDLLERAGAERLSVGEEAKPVPDPENMAGTHSLSDDGERVEVVEGSELEGVVVRSDVRGPRISERGVKRIVCSTSHLRAQIVFHFDGVPDFEYGVLQPAGSDKHGRIFIDIRGDGLKRSVERALRSCMGGIIKESRYGKQPGGMQRLVFDVYTPSSFRLYPLTGDSLVLHFTRRAPEGVVPFIRSVALDPGHGGENKGAVGPTGVREKDVVLGVARAAARRLTAHRISVVLTRQADEDVSLEERTAKALAAGADLFISIHANADPGGRRQAVDTFYLNTGGDEYSRRLAHRENESAGKPAPVDRLVWARLLDHRIVEQSKALAREVHPRVLSAVKAHLPDTNDGGIRKALFHVLLNARMPGILVELSHISHPMGEEFLHSPRNQELMGEALAAGIVEYVKKHNSEATAETFPKWSPPVRPPRRVEKDESGTGKKVSRDERNIIQSEEGTIRIRR